MLCRSFWGLLSKYKDSQCGSGQHSAYFFSFLPNWDHTIYTVCYFFFLFYTLTCALLRQALLNPWECDWCYARLTCRASGKSSVSCPAPAPKTTKTPNCHQSKFNPLLTTVWVLQSLVLLWLPCPSLSA